MKKYKLKKVGKEMFEDFYNQSIFTFEGLSIKEESLNSLCDYLGLTNEHLIYTYLGKDMNEYYGLENKNAYPKNLQFVSIPNGTNFILKKIQVGARWFDDIVDNNLMKK